MKDIDNVLMAIIIGWTTHHPRERAFADNLGSCLFSMQDYFDPTGRNIPIFGDFTILNPQQNLYGTSRQPREMIFGMYAYFDPSQRNMKKTS